MAAQRSGLTQALGGRRKVIDVINILLGFAQIALGLAGFSAILVALSGSPHEWTPVDAFRIKNMLAFCFQAIFLALAPVLLTLLSVAEPDMWRISLIILSTATFGSAVFAFCNFRRLSQPDRAVLRQPLVYSLITLLLFASLLEMATALSNFAPAPGAFFAGLLVLLGLSVFLVIRFLFVRPAAA